MTRDDVDTLLKVFEILAFIGAGGVTIVTVTRAVTKFELVGKQQSEQIKEMKETIKKVGDAVSEMAAEKVRLDELTRRIARNEETIELLRRGEGMILPLDMSLARKIYPQGGGG